MACSRPLHITIHGGILRHGQNRLGYAVCIEAGSQGIRVRFLHLLHPLYGHS